jgi:cell division protein DivIC
MNLIRFFLHNKIILVNLFLIIYLVSNFIGGERGLISYFKKKEQLQLLQTELNKKNKELEYYDKRIELLSESPDQDYLETLYREKFNVGKKNEIVIDLK